MCARWADYWQIVKQNVLFLSLCAAESSWGKLKLRSTLGTFNSNKAAAILIIKMFSTGFWLMLQNTHHDRQSEDRCARRLFECVLGGIENIRNA